MKRRTFIWTPLLLSFSARLSADIYPNPSLVFKNHARIECELLFRCFSNLSRAAEVGRRYLLNNPALDNVDELLRDVALVGANTSVNDQFEAAKRRDFTVGNTVCLEGWVLSKAEASLCALAYLSVANV